MTLDGGGTAPGVWRIHQAVLRGAWPLGCPGCAARGCRQRAVLPAARGKRHGGLPAAAGMPKTPALVPLVPCRRRPQQVQERPRARAHFTGAAWPATARHVRQTTAAQRTTWSHKQQSRASRSRGPAQLRCSRRCAAWSPALQAVYALTPEAWFKEQTTSGLQGLARVAHRLDCGFLASMCEEALEPRVHVGNVQDMLAFTRELPGFMPGAQHATPARVPLLRPVAAAAKAMHVCCLVGGTAAGLCKPGVAFLGSEAGEWGWAHSRILPAPLRRPGPSVHARLCAQPAPLACVLPGRGRPGFLTMFKDQYSVQPQRSSDVVGTRWLLRQPSKLLLAGSVRRAGIWTVGTQRLTCAVHIEPELAWSDSAMACVWGRLLAWRRASCAGSLICSAARALKANGAHGGLPLYDLLWLTAAPGRQLAADHLTASPAGRPALGCWQSCSLFRPDVRPDLDALPGWAASGPERAPPRRAACRGGRRGLGHCRAPGAVVWAAQT